jgi:large subunit ribosomal protein L29
MATQEKINYAELTPDELRRMVREKREGLFKMRFQSATAPLKNPKAIGATRRDIARLLTFLRQKGAEG